MIDAIPFIYQGTTIRAAVLDNGIYFVFRDLCRVKGFRTATEKAGDKPVYQKIKTPVGSTTVRLMSRDSVFVALSYMHHMEKYADEEFHLYQWLMRDVLPALYKRPDCKQFIPHAPWATRFESVSDAPRQEKKPNAEKIKDTKRTLFAFLLLTGILDSMPVMLVRVNGTKEKSRNDR